MKPFEDSISEENTPPYQDLTGLLQQATPGVSVTVEEQSQMLARVRARLHQTDDLASEGNVEMMGRGVTLRAPGSPASSAGGRTQGDAPTHRRRRIKYTLNMIAAVLVVAIIAGASLWLFSARRSSSPGGNNIPTGAPVGAIKAPVIVRSEAGGLEASLQVTSGPYFLSELLAATVTLTNHSNKTVFLQGGDAPLNFCNAAFSLVTTGGNEPHYSFSLDKVTMDCPSSQMKLDPGKTVTSHGYVPLTKSGHVTLVPSARFFTAAKDSSGLTGIVSGHSPLDGHWPVMHISVAPKIPQDRTLSLRQQNSTVIINAPAVTSHALVYYYVVTCVGTVGTSAQWYPVTSLILHEPECSGANKHWTYAVGAPGYAIASREMSS